MRVLAFKQVKSAMKKLKNPLEIGCIKAGDKKGCYYIMSVGYDTNGNWSYMVSKGGSKPKKIQHQGEWGNKVTPNTTQENLDNMSDFTKDMLDYIEEFVSFK